MRLALLVLVSVIGIAVELRRRLAVEYPPPPAGGAVLVSGGSTGIGFDICVALAAETSFVPFCGVRKEVDAKRLRAISHGRIRPLILDVTKQEQIDAAIAAVRESGLPLAGLVNCAGGTARGLVETTHVEAYRRLMDVNFFGVIALSQAALPLLREAQGRLVTIGSFVGLVSLGLGLSAYGASKFALEPLHDALRNELLPARVSVSLVEPGAVRTEIMATARAQGHFQGRDDAGHPRASELDAAYRWYFEAPELESSVALADQHADSPAVVTRAVQHALTAPRPQARYIVANLNGTPAWVLVALLRVLPDRLRDLLMMAPFRARWGSP